MKKSGKILATVLIIGGIAVIIAALLFLLVGYVPETDRYSDYEVVDCNLTWTDTGRALGEYTKDENGSQVYYKYKKIRGEDKDIFVGAWRRPDELFAIGDNVLLVSPDRKLDVWKDWTVSKIELFYVDSHGDGDEWMIGEFEPDDIKKATAAETNDGEILREFIGLVDNISEYSKPENGYSAQTPPPKGGVNGTLYCGIRVHFEESESIVWEATIDVYSSDIDKKIYLRRLSLDSDIYDVTEIPQGSKVYDFLINGMYN